MEYTGKIKKLNHVVISDPSYDSSVGTRYEKKRINGHDWLVHLYINPIEEELDNHIVKSNNFILLIKKYKGACKIENEDTIEFSEAINLKQYNIDMDTACVAFGINNKAKKIIDSKDNFQPDCAIKTGTDGVFGYAMEGTIGNKLEFLLLTGSVEEFFMDQDELFDYIKEQFELTELEKKDFTLVGEDQVLDIGDKVEVYSCSIAQKNHYLEDIRNIDYKSKTAGMEITKVDLEGNVIDKTILGDNDKKVQNPINIEVTKRWYDYETGYRYKGIICDKKLERELKKMGLEICSTETEKSNKKESASFIACFSEFDIVKILERNNEITEEKVDNCDMEKEDLEL